MIQRLLTLACLWALLPGLALAQTTREEVTSDLNKAGGVYRAYPVAPARVSAPPKGYEPFYISHYGRHGSRYLIADNDYRQVLALMRKASQAHALTPLGEDALRRVELVWAEAQGHGGDLTPLGWRQHQDIARRMCEHYPQVFKAGGRVSARSTVVLRCAMSMAAFCDGLKGCFPKLQVYMEASNKYMAYLNYHSKESSAFAAPDGPWREQYRKFEASHVDGWRLARALFSDSDFIVKQVNPRALAWGFYWLAADAQNTEGRVSFFDLFTPDELFDLWQTFNYRFYVADGNYAGNRGMALDNAKPLLRNIIASADSAIAGRGDVATLRFGHDGNLIPLAGLMRLKDCYASVEKPDSFYKYFSDFKIAPMAGNIQLVFYKNRQGQVIVKFMLNEQETSIPVPTAMAPFYRWSDVKRYYETQVLP